jgi:hypothetical protein
MTTWVAEKSVHLEAKGKGWCQTSPKTPVPTPRKWIPDGVEAIRDESAMWTHYEDAITGHRSWTSTTGTGAPRENIMIVLRLNGTYGSVQLSVNNPLEDLRQHLTDCKIHQIDSLTVDGQPLDRTPLYHDSFVDATTSQENVRLWLTSSNTNTTIPVFTEAWKSDYSISIEILGVSAWTPWNDIFKYWRSQGVQWMVGSCRGKLATNQNIDFGSVIKIAQVDSRELELEIIHDWGDRITVHTKYASVPNEVHPVELRAVLETLIFLPPNITSFVSSDSQYGRLGITQWQAQGWGAHV